MKTFLISIGVDKADNDHYLDKFNALTCCVRDATDMYQYFNEQLNIEQSDLICNLSATSSQLISLLDRNAKWLEAGDLLLLFYSGHGAQVDDIRKNEKDKFNETWCLYDRMIVDDELFFQYSKFRKDVNILVFSDSCHSGTVIRNHENVVVSKTSKLVPSKAANSIINANGTAYKAYQDLDFNKKNIDASLILFAACQDKQQASAGTPNSFFTTALLAALKADGFNKKLDDLFVDLSLKMEAAPNVREQDPNFYPYGKKKNIFIEKSIHNLAFGI